MDQNYHIFKSGVLKRKNNTLALQEFADQDNANERATGDHHYIPVEKAASIYAHGQIRVNTKCLDFLSQNDVLLHIFNWKEYYSGTYIPRESSVSGDMLVKQAAYHNDPEKRLPIAKEFVRGSSLEMRENLQYYQYNGESVQPYLNEMAKLHGKLRDQPDVESVMGIEGSIRSQYYKGVGEVVPSNFLFTGRDYNPPPNPVNALFSFGNALLYNAILREIHCTRVNPTVSFLHAPSERRFSLSLDIADVFKPLIVDRVIFRLLNRGELTEAHFESSVGKCLLSESGRKKFTIAFEKQLEETVEHPDLSRHVSYQYLLRLEVYKLQKHFLGDQEYNSFERWW